MLQLAGVPPLDACASLGAKGAGSRRYARAPRSIGRHCGTNLEWETTPGTNEETWSEPETWPR